MTGAKQLRMTMDTTRGELKECNLHWDRFPSEIQNMVLHHLQSMLTTQREWESIKVMTVTSENYCKDEPNEASAIPTFRGVYRQCGHIVVHPDDCHQVATAANDKENHQDDTDVAFVIDFQGNVAVQVYSDAEDVDDPDASLPYAYQDCIQKRFWISKECKINVTSHSVPPHAQLPCGKSVMAWRSDWDTWNDVPSTFFNYNIEQLQKY